MTSLTTCEKAFPIESVLQKLNELQDTGDILLGGDILDAKGHYTYDSWYYLPNPQADQQQNCIDSMKKAREYLSVIMKNLGTQYYVIPVMQKLTPRNIESLWNMAGRQFPFCE